MWRSAALGTVVSALLRTSAARLATQRMQDSRKEAVTLQLWMVQPLLHNGSGCSCLDLVPERTWGSAASQSGGEEWSLPNSRNGCG